MKYRIDQNNYHTFSTYEINKMPGRSYFIPYPDRASADAVTPKEKRYSSSKVVCLNGRWDFSGVTISRSISISAISFLSSRR